MNENLADVNEFDISFSVLYLYDTIEINTIEKPHQFCFFFFSFVFFQSWVRMLGLLGVSFCFPVFQVASLPAK